MNKRKSGFTLMEIMVVIIVIAVLASVAGPMIGSITDQGRASATKSKLSSIKSALLAYQTDVGRLPHGGYPKKVGSYCQDQLMSANEEDKNVLYSNSDTGYTSLSGDGVGTGKAPGNYSRRWKGPYIDSDPSDFMWDAWGNKIIYIAQNKNIYLWSAGPDGSYFGKNGKTGGEAYTDGNVEDAFKFQTNAETGCDDIVVSVARTKSKIEN